MQTSPDPDERWPVASPEPPPVPGATDVLPALLAYLEARARVGLAKYGTPLQSHNGRSALRDALDEACDQAMYLMQATLEAPRFRLGQQVRYRPHHQEPHAATQGWHPQAWRVVSITTEQHLRQPGQRVTYGVEPWAVDPVVEWMAARPVVPVTETQLAPWREEDV